MNTYNDGTIFPLLRKLAVEEIKGYNKLYDTERKLNNAIKKLMLEIDEVENAQAFDNLSIIIEWKKSRTWSSNPRASASNGFSGSSISGCGYDKLSTATAEALNSDKRLLKIMYMKKEQELKNRKPLYTEQNGREENTERALNQYLYGYGSGYGALPRFEGGVGVNCHIRICAKLGLDMEQVINTKDVDVYNVKVKA